MKMYLATLLNGGDLLTAGCLYCSPSGNAHQGVDEWEHLLYSVLAVSASSLLICGNSNILQIHWASSFCCAPDSHHAQMFLM